MNEKPLVRKMREEYRYFGGLSFIYGLIFAFCFYRNTYGVTFPICVAVTIVFVVLFMKKIGYVLQKKSLPYIIGMLLLSISTTLTTSFFLRFFNWAGVILLFFVFMIHQFYNDMEWNLPGYLKRILILFGTTIEYLAKPYSHGMSYLSGNKNGRNRTIIAVAIGCVTALGMLCVILPLLLRSDMVFSRLFGEILKHINFVTIIGVSVTFIIGFTLCYAFFGALCKYNFPQYTGQAVKTYNPVVGITFTSIISIIYLLYCVIQIMYLFLGIQKGLPVNVTYSQYARGGFWELLFVGIINFVMVLLCMYLFSENIVLKAILTVISGCTFIMIISAAYRMMLYIGAYHLTFLRILVMWFLVVLALIMGGVIVSIYQKKFPLFHYIMAVVGVLYICLSFSRPDAIVAKYNIAHTEFLEYNDIIYLTQLSEDAAPALAEIDSSKFSDLDVKTRVYNYFYFITQEDENIYFRKANYSRIRARLTAEQYIKDHQKLQVNESGDYEEYYE